MSPHASALLKLIVFHYHFRSGGVRRVIETAAPFLLRALPSIGRVIAAGGEAREVGWNATFRRSLAPVPVDFFIEPAFGYASEQPAPDGLGQRIRAALGRLFEDGEPAIVWAHNLGIARNLHLARELARACDARGIAMIAHHHDWWFDNRWLRWPEMKRAGFRTLNEVARTLFPATENARFAAINRADANLLRRHFGTCVHWLPNPVARPALPSARRVRSAQSWLRAKLGEDAPVWLMPCRILRRKNVAEALLLTRWLRPEAMLVTTGGASSPDEEPYARRLADAAREHGWRLRFGVLADNETAQPSLPEMLGASECLLLTSIQEGFGLAPLEAAAAGRPLIARRLPNIAPDFRRFGFRFPQCYREILIAPGVFDWEAEQRRQRSMYREWKNALPRNCRAWAEPPMLLQCAIPAPVPFSRLTLSAQIEVLALPAAHSWKLCANWNPLLRVWKARAGDGCLETTQWPESADDWLGGESYARRFAEIVRCHPRKAAKPNDACAAQEEFIRLKLRTAQLFPLLFSKKS